MKRPTTVEPRGPLCLSGHQRNVLRQAAAAGWLEQPSGQDENIYVEMWRAGLLRMNGGPGYQISRLGIESLERGG